MSLQRLGRGFVTRKWFAIQFRRAFLERVECPAAVQLQAIARMRAQFVLLAGRKEGYALVRLLVRLLVPLKKRVSIT